MITVPLETELRATTLREMVPSSIRRVVPRPVKRVIGRFIAAPEPPYEIDKLVDLGNTRAVRAFVVRTDQLGGPTTPATQEWWQTLEFTVPADFRQPIDDPLSPAYFALQDRFYQTLVGSSYRGATSERTTFDKMAARKSHLAYPGWAPKDLNRHINALVRLVEQFDSADRVRVLEAGSGWGFACEYLARLGYRVVGVDINRDFVKLAQYRSERFRLAIDYRLGTFERLPLADNERFNVIFTSAALHHSRRPLLVLQNFVRHLTPGGQVILSAEPFIDPAMWPHWGLRTDPLSIYCIAKFGWWESGWTLEFMMDLFKRVGLTPQFVDLHSDFERYLIGRHSTTS